MLPELPEAAARQMSLGLCSGCTACSMKCAGDVACSQPEWQAIERYLQTLPPSEKQQILNVLQQDKTESLAEGEETTLCRFLNMQTRLCSIYPVRPRICRLLGHVEWLPCPIQRIPRTLTMQQALPLLAETAPYLRKTLAEWVQQSPLCTDAPQAFLQTGVKEE